MFGALLLLAAAAGAPAAHPAALVGHYDGGQIEIAAELDLAADGRFHYALAYGALDEEAQGNWAVVGHFVVLHGDPVTPPRFVLVRQQPGSPHELAITLDAPQGINPGLFVASIDFADGSDGQRQFAADGARFALAPANPPRHLRLMLPIVELRGEAIDLDPAKGLSLAFRFEPNDIGKADFPHEPLEIEGRDLLLQRHGRTLRFSPTARP